LGYFAYAYIVEAVEDESGLAITRSIYREHLDRRALFSWDEGERPPGMHEYADGTLFCSEQLNLLPGYPLRQRLSNDNGTPLFLMEEGFSPEYKEEPILFHILLPTRYVPRPNLTPLQQPSTPSIIKREDRLVVSYAVQGGGDIRVWIGRMAEGDGFGSYDLNRVLQAPSSTSAKVTFELNLGIVKVSIG
jgi:hypothetical protein